MKAADIAQWVTALGVLLLAVQLLLMHIQSRSQFELTFSARYEECVKHIPLELLLGIEGYDELNTKARRAFYDYFELCEQECYYRLTHRIGRRTWNDWRTGIQANLRKPAFQAAWLELSEKVPSQFEGFRSMFGPVLPTRPTTS